MAKLLNGLKLVSSPCLDIVKLSLGQVFTCRIFQTRKSCQFARGIASTEAKEPGRYHGGQCHHGSGLRSRKEAAGWAVLRQCRCPYDSCSALRDRDPPGTASGELAIWRSLKAQRHASLKLRTSEALDQTLTTTLPIWALDSRKRVASWICSRWNVRAMTGFSCPEESPLVMKAFARSRAASLFVISPFR